MNHMSPLDRAAADRLRLDAEFARLGAILAGEAEPPMPELPPTRLDALADTFGLAAPDVMVLLLAAAPSLAPHLLGDKQPTVGLAARLIGDDVWRALGAQAPLRGWRMLELEGSGPERDRTLRLDERIRAHLLGLDYLDPRLDGLLAPVIFSNVDGSNTDLLERLERSWVLDRQTGWPVLQLCGPQPEAKRAIAAALCSGHGLRLYRLDRADLPHTPYERRALAILANRELVLLESALLLEGDATSEGGDDRAATSFIEAMDGPVIVAARDVLVVEGRRLVRADLAAAGFAERRKLWAASGPGEASGDDLDRLAEQFGLDARGVRAVAALATTEAGANETRFQQLWDGARLQARGRLDGLAERVESAVSWDDLVLPPDRLEQLRDITMHVRRAHQVNGAWGWAGRGARGLGVTALFAGPSGTGKTMAAEVLANELHLDLYRIDLSRVISKYIGETEKNLRRIFEAAEASGAILLFDEADALFGKRSDVKDSHDRYANVEVSYLLQQMEAYRGLAILTTNLKNSLDTAFMRRLRFVIDFPFPDAGLRAGIWRRIFPAATPMAGDDLARMARLAVAGGTIRTIAINAAFFAADAGEPVGLKHLELAARREYMKLDKPVTNAEFGGLN